MRWDKGLFHNTILSLDLDFQMRRIINTIRSHCNDIINHMHVDELYHSILIWSCPEVWCQIWSMEHMRWIHSTGFQIWPLPMLFLNSLRNNIFWKNICKGFCSCKSQRNAKFDILHWWKWVPDVSPLQNVKFRVSLTFTAAKVFVNIFSRKYYFTNNLEITLAGAKFWTLCCDRWAYIL